MLERVINIYSTFSYFIHSFWLLFKERGGFIYIFKFHDSMGLLIEGGVLNCGWVGALSRKYGSSSLKLLSLLQSHDQSMCFHWLSLCRSHFITHLGSSIFYMQLMTFFVTVTACYMWSSFHSKSVTLYFFNINFINLTIQWFCVFLRNRSTQWSKCY